MIVDEIYVVRIAVTEAKDDAPIARHRDRPEALRFARSRCYRIMLVHRFNGSNVQSQIRNGSKLGPAPFKVQGSRVQGSTTDADGLAEQSPFKSSTFKGSRSDTEWMRVIVCHSVRRVPQPGSRSCASWVRCGHQVADGIEDFELSPSCFFYASNFGQASWKLAGCSSSWTILRRFPDDWIGAFAFMPRHQRSCRIFSRSSCFHWNSPRWPPKIIIGPLSLQLTLRLGTIAQHTA